VQTKLLIRWLPDDAAASSRARSERNGRLRDVTGGLFAACRDALLSLIRIRKPLLYPLSYEGPRPTSYLAWGYPRVLGRPTACQRVASGPLATAPSLVGGRAEHFRAHAGRRAQRLISGATRSPSTCGACGPGFQQPHRCPDMTTPRRNHYRSAEQVAVRVVP
jgi:hypothetical protein